MGKMSGRYENFMPAAIPTHNLLCWIPVNYFSSETNWETKILRIYQDLNFSKKHEFFIMFLNFRFDWLNWLKTEKDKITEKESAEIAESGYLKS